jgi:hypothetical protein
MLPLPNWKSLVTCVVTFARSRSVRKDRVRNLRTPLADRSLPWRSISRDNNRANISRIRGAIPVCCYLPEEANLSSESDLEILVAIPATPRNERDVRPRWKYFCCCDSGLVDNPYLSQLVIDKNGRPFVYQRLDCTAGEKFRNAYFATDAQRQEYA